MSGPWPRSSRFPLNLGPVLKPERMDSVHIQTMPPAELRRTRSRQRRRNPGQTQGGSGQTGCCRAGAVPGQRATESAKCWAWAGPDAPTHLMFTDCRGTRTAGLGCRVRELRTAQQNARGLCGPVCGRVAVSGSSSHWTHGTRGAGAPAGC